MVQASNRTGTLRLSVSERRSILLIGDLLASGLALLSALVFWAQKDWYNLFAPQFFEERIPFWFFLLPLVWVVLIIELYDIRRASHRVETLKGIGLAILLGGLLYLVVFFISEPESLPRRGVAAFVGFSAVFTLIWRFIYISIFTASQFMRRALVIGAGRAGSVLAEILAGLKPAPFTLVGLLDDDPQKIGTQISGFPVLGSISQLNEIMISEHISDIIFAISGELQPETFQTMLKVQESGVEVTTMAKVYEDLLGRVPISLLQSDWILRSFTDEYRSSGFYEMGKRTLDIIGGVAGVILLGLMLPFVSLAIYLDTGKPILFTQMRLGLFGQVYKIIKFRTMINSNSTNVRVTIDHDERITRVGRFLRKSHLDEFPNFISVLRGEMSLVGPRAEQVELVNELQRKIPFYRARLLVKPGITGWAQVNFGYAATVEDTATKLEYDLYYIKHRSLILEVVILLRTFGSVFGFRGR